MFQDRFVHETYANLSYVSDVMEHAVETFKMSSLRNKSVHVQNELTNVLCNMVKVNRKIHCRKNKNKPSRRMIAFNKTGVCEKRDLFKNVSTRSELIVRSLESLKHVQKVIADTLGFWDSCVKDSKNGKLVSSKRCKKRKRCKNGKSKRKYQRRRYQRRKKNGKKQKKRAKKTKLFSSNWKKYFKNIYICDIPTLKKLRQQEIDNNTLVIWTYWGIWFSFNYMYMCSFSFHIYRLLVPIFIRWISFIYPQICTTYMYICTDNTKVTSL